MGTVKSGILSKVSGKVGKVVGSNWKGIEYLRSMPSQYKDAKTEEQIWYRTRFSKMVKFMQVFTEVVQLGFKSGETKKSAFNVALAYNYHAAMTGIFPDLDIDLSKIMLSKGQLYTCNQSGVLSNTVATLSINWSSDTGIKWSQATDDVVVVVYHPEIEDSWIGLKAAKRSDTTVDVLLPQVYSGAQVHVYLAFFTSIGKNKGKANGISNTVYLGEVMVQ